MLVLVLLSRDMEQEKAKKEDVLEEYFFDSVKSEDIEPGWIIILWFVVPGVPP